MLRLLLSWTTLPACGERNTVVTCCGPVRVLDEYVAHDVTVHVAQPEVAARVPVGEPLVVEAHEVQDRRVEVVYGHRPVGDVHAQLVDRSVAGAAPDAAAGEQHREC